MSWLCTAPDGPPGPGVQHGPQLPEVSQDQKLHVGVQPHAGQVRPERHVQLRDLLHHQPVQLLRAAPTHVPAHPVVGRLGPQAQVLRGAVRLGHQVHRLSLLSQPCHNGPGQVRLSGARQASSLPRGRPACRPGGAAPPAPAAAPQSASAAAASAGSPSSPARGSAAARQNAPGHAVLKAENRVVDGAVGAVAQQPSG